MSAVTPAMVLCVVLRSAAAASAQSGAGVPGAERSASESIRQTRWRNRAAPSTPEVVHSTSRSGGLSESMNQRAVSAPYSSMIARDR